MTFETPQGTGRWRFAYSLKVDIDSLLRDFPVVGLLHRRPVGAALREQLKAEREATSPRMELSA